MTSGRLRNSLVAVLAFYRRRDLDRRLGFRGRWRRRQIQAPWRQRASATPARSRSLSPRPIVTVRAGRSPESSRPNETAPALARSPLNSRLRKPIPAILPVPPNCSRCRPRRRGLAMPRDREARNPKAPRGDGPVLAKVDEPKLAAPQLLAPAPAATPVKVEQGTSAPAPVETKAQPAVVASESPAPVPAASEADERQVELAYFVPPSDGYDDSAGDDEGHDDAYTGSSYGDDGCN
jgi:hypothetical protein